MEVLISVAILGIGLGVIMELFSGGLRSARISEEVTQAVWYGRAKMEDLMTAKELTEGVAEDAFNSQFSWSSEVTKVPPPLGLEAGENVTLPIDLYRIVVKVIWRSGHGQRSLEMESLRAFKGEGGVK